MKIQKTNAMRWLETRKLDFDVMTYPHKKTDPVDGVHVAHQLNEPYDQVFKTLVCQANTKEYFVFMLPVDKELDFKKCAKAAKVKSMEMIHLKDLTKVTGYIRGGCSPIGMKKSFKTFIDESVILQPKIYFSAGKIGMQIHMDSETLISALKIEVADLCML